MLVSKLTKNSFLTFLTLSMIYLLTKTTQSVSKTLLKNKDLPISTMLLLNGPKNSMMPLLTKLSKMLSFQKPNNKLMDSITILLTGPKKRLT